MQTSHRVRGIFWGSIFLLLTIAPLLILFVDALPAGRDFWVEFSVALAFAGLSMLGLQFGVTARFRHITSAWGIDIVYHFHRQISLIAFAFVLAHPLILFVVNPETMQLLNVIEAPWRARFGVAAVVLLIALVVTSLWRVQLRLQYEVWRLSHGILATLIILLAMLHVLGVGHYINSPLQRGLWIALTVIWIGLLVYVRIIKPIWMIRRPYAVEQIIPERGDSYTLILKPVGHAGFEHKPGQFAWLSLWNTPFAITEHPFSIASSAENDNHIAFTIKNLGDFTSTIANVKPGKRAYIDGPYGTFSVDRFTAQAYTFIGGGVGVTPIMGTLRTLADRGSTHDLTLIYGNPNWEDVTYREELEELKQRLNLRVIHVLEEPPDDWQGETGFVTAELLRRYLPADLEQHEYFICGPDPMMDAVEAALEELEVPLDKYHSERYNLN